MDDSHAQFLLRTQLLPDENIPCLPVRWVLAKSMMFANRLTLLMIRNLYLIGGKWETLTSTVLPSTPDYRGFSLLLGSLRKLQLLKKIQLHWGLLLRNNGWITLLDLLSRDWMQLLPSLFRRLSTGSGLCKGHRTDTGRIERGVYQMLKLNYGVSASKEGSLLQYQEMFSKLLMGKEDTSAWKCVWAMLTSCEVLKRS